MISDSGSRIVRYWLWLLLLLAACTGAPPPDTTPTDESHRLEQPKTADELIQLAEASGLPSQRHEWMLQAITRLLADNNSERAIYLLEQLPAHELENPQLARYTLLYADWALTEKHYPLAGVLLTDPRVEVLARQVDSPSAIPLAQLRAVYFEESWQFNEALDERLALSLLLLDNRAVSENNQSIWRILGQLQSDRISALALSGQSQIKPWLELAAISKSNSIDIQPQLDQLLAWKQRWQGHPATMALPAEIRHLETLSAARPQHITLLLPQSGPLASAGQAVIDGFLAAYYEARTQTSELPVIEFVDSQREEDFLALYQSVANTGTDLIIGPLDKQKLQRLFELETLPVPTLALNHVEASNITAPEGLTQFGLSPEDDTRQILDFATIRGYRNVMILVPESSWGERVARFFTDGWLLREGNIVGITYFNAEKGDYSSAISHFLGIDDSKQRQKQVQRLVGESLEFEPRRRQDIDVILLSAQPEDARQIKPMLAFHYANDLPLIATSTIYSGFDDPIKDNDLNDTLFLALPWQLEKSTVKQAISTHLGEKNRFQGLYALGVDSYRLHVRPGLLESSSDSQINGSTGVLKKAADSGRINRQQVWMKMVSGHARHYSPEH